VALGGRCGDLGRGRRRSDPLAELLELKLELLAQPPPALGGLSILLAPRQGDQQFQALDVGLRRDARGALDEDHRMLSGDSALADALIRSGAVADAALGVALSALGASPSLST